MLERQSPVWSEGQGAVLPRNGSVTWPRVRKRDIRYELTVVIIPWAHSCFQKLSLANLLHSGEKKKNVFPQVASIDSPPSKSTLNMWEVFL